MKAMCVVFYDISPATLLASPASTMSTSFSIGGFRIISPIWVQSSLVSIIADLLVIMSCWWCAHSISFNHLEVLIMTFPDCFNARNRIPVSIRRVQLWLLIYCTVSVFDSCKDFSQIHSIVWCTIFFAEVATLLQLSRCARSIVPESMWY
jgi:hypothetical protein